MISVVIPAKDEAKSVISTVTDVRRVLANTTHEVIVVDDGSDDKTDDCAKEAGARVIRHPHNLGYGAAIKTGIQAAVYDTIVIIDADGSYPCDAILSLLDKFRLGFDMVVGQRQGVAYRGSVIKRVLRYLLKFMVEFTSGNKVPDVNSGLRVFSKCTIRKYFNHLCDTFSFTTSLTLAYLMTRRFVTYVPISYSERLGKTKVRLGRDMLRTTQYIVQSAVYYNPLKIFLLFSAIICIFSLGNFGIAFFSRLGVFYFIGIGGILVSILVFCMGLLAVLLRQIMIKD